MAKKKKAAKAPSKPQGGAELKDAELDKVAGGITIGWQPAPVNGLAPPPPGEVALGSQVISPRDPATGLPTGKRM